MCYSIEKSRLRSCRSKYVCLCYASTKNIFQLVSKPKPGSTKGLPLTQDIKIPRLSPDLSPFSMTNQT